MENERRVFRFLADVINKVHPTNKHERQERFLPPVQRQATRGIHG